MTRRTRMVPLIFLWVFFTAASAQTIPHRAVSPKTQIVILGTGNPSPNPATMGPSIAIVMKGEVYIVDAGVGLVRRASAASRGVAGLEMPNLKCVFVTHPTAITPLACRI
jgi:hypothetical protein